MDGRRVSRVVEANETRDGDGVRVWRTIGTPLLDHVDPFLLLDELRLDEARGAVPGFPEHPHRGFETVSYLLAGAMHHRDRAGHAGVVRPGGVQWMTAGRGIVHSETPAPEAGGLLGFQLWINLPARDKLGPPRYREFPPESVPERELPGGGRLRVVAGEAAGAVGPVAGVVTRPLFLDLALPAGAAFEQPLPPDHSAVLYVFEGSLNAGVEVGARQLALLEGDGGVRLAAGSAGGRGLLLAAAPLREPIARFGPFVMNTRAELAQAADDFHAGRLGAG